MSLVVSAGAEVSDVDSISAVAAAVAETMLDCGDDADGATATEMGLGEGVVSDTFCIADTWILIEDGEVVGLMTTEPRGSLLSSSSRLVVRMKPSTSLV